MRENNVLVLGYMESIRIVVNNTEKGKTLTFSSRNNNSYNSKENETENIFYKYIVGEPRFSKKAELSRLLEIWSRYNMNDMQNGTPKQTEALLGKGFNYQESVEYLDKINLLEDDGHVYGSKYLFEEIPKEVINELQFIIENW